MRATKHIFNKTISNDKIVGQTPGKRACVHKIRTRVRFPVYNNFSIGQHRKQYTSDQQSISPMLAISMPSPQRIHRAHRRNCAPSAANQIN